MSVEVENAAPSSASSATEQRNRLVEMVRRWGGLASDAILDPACHYYSDPNFDGFIGYRFDGQAAVALGDPVCPSGNTDALVSSFHRHCRGKGWRCLYISTSEEFARWAIARECSALIKFGDEFYLDPHCDPRSKTGTHGSLVRRKVRHAQHEGVVVEEYTIADEKMEEAIDQVGARWLESRKGPQIHISHMRLFNDKQGKRWFYAKRGDQIIGTAVLNRLEKNDGWLLNHIIFTPDAPGGTPELLVVEALEAAAKTGSHYVTFGNSTTSQLGETIGLGTFSTYLARWGFKAANKIFHLAGHKMFWDKFNPESRPSFLLFTEPKIGFKELLALKKALNVTI